MCIHTDILKDKRAITLIALIITIVILLVLAGISIAMLTGKNEMTINADVVTVDGWQFKIDRSVPEIIASFGKGEESQKITIAETVEVVSDYTKVNVKIEITSDNEVSTIKINDEEIDVPEKTDEKYVVEKEVQENGNYLIYVKTSNEEYKTNTVKVVGISEDTEIYTVEQLETFRDRVNNGTTYAGRTITLKNDLNLKDKEWIPIGNYWTSDTDKATFNGTFDGENYTINNMKIIGQDNIKWRNFF